MSWWDFHWLSSKPKGSDAELRDKEFVTDVRVSGETGVVPPRVYSLALHSPTWVGCENDILEIDFHLRPEATDGEAGGSDGLSECPFDIGINLHLPGLEPLESFGKYEKPFLSFSLEDSPLTRDPRRKIRFRIQELEEPQQKALREVSAVLSRNGQIVGIASVAFWVCRDQRVKHITEHSSRHEQQARDRCCPWRRIDETKLPADSNRPDLTIFIERYGAELTWRVLSIFGVEVSEVRKALSERAIEDFVGSLQQRIEENRANAYLLIRNFGTWLAEFVPETVRNAVQRVVDFKKVENSEDAVSILFMGEQTQIPWELVVVEDQHWNFRYGNTSPFLGANARIGRWLDRNSVPEYPPPVSTEARKMTVICGRYLTSEWQDLHFAREEAAELVQLLGPCANHVEARCPQDVHDVIQDDDRSQAFHFALHGKKVGDAGMQAGLVLPPGDAYLCDHDVDVKRPFRAKPFIFMNACDMANVFRLLDRAGGLGVALAEKGAGALVTPLWKINDASAKKVALDFYRDIKQGLLVAEALRLQRARFTAENPDPEHVAYQLMGHPQYRLNLGAGAAETLQEP